MSFKDLTIYIPTLGRSDKQLTFKNLSPELKKITKLVIHKSEAGMYDDYPHIICPEYDIAAKRRWIVMNCKTKYLSMLDDDLHFYIRISDEVWNLRYTKAADMNELFEHILEMLEGGYIHVGVSDRSGNHLVSEPVVENQRMMRFLCYDVAAVKKHAKFCRVDYQEDFDICLQLLYKGFPNLVIYKWAQGNPGFNKKGGCEVDRTMERHNKSVRRLAELHPGFVAITKKKDKGAGEFGKRDEVRVQWKKAFASSQK